MTDLLTEDRPRLAAPAANAGASDPPAPPRRRVSIDVTAAAVAKIVAGLLLLAFIGDLAGRMRDIFVWILAATFLAIALNPLVERLEPRLGRRPAATVVVIGFVILFIGVVIAPSLRRS